MSQVHVPSTSELMTASSPLLIIKQDKIKVVNFNLGLRYLPWTTPLSQLLLFPVCGFYWTPARELHTKEETQLSLGDISRFLSKSGHIRRLQKQKFFFLPYKSLHFERHSTVTSVISSLGHLCSNQTMVSCSCYCGRLYKRGSVFYKGYMKRTPFWAKMACTRVFFLP